jgi:hypothetical protein
MSGILLFFGFLAIAFAIIFAAWLLRNSIFTVRVSQGYLVPKELMPKSSVQTTDEGQKRPSRRARDLT